MGISRMERKFRLPTWLKVAAVFAGGSTLCPTEAHAANVTVNTLAPNTAGDGKCGLVEAVQAVNQASTYRNCTYTPNGQSDRIVFSVNGTHTLPDGIGPTRSVEIVGSGTGSTILTGSAFCVVCVFGASSGASQTVKLTNLAVTIAPTSITMGIWAEAPSPITLVLSGTLVRGFGVGAFLSGSTVTGQVSNAIFENNGTGLSLSNGYLQVSSSIFRYNTSRGITLYQYGSPHYNYIANSVFLNNSGGPGAGVYVHAANDAWNQYTLSITDSTFQGNQSATHGGGLYTEASTSILRSVFDGNTAAGRGGGMVASERPNGGAYINVESTTFKNNAAANGAGFANYAPSDGQRVKVTLWHSTFGPDNVASGDGGGIYSESQIDWAENVTIHGNRAARGGGLYHYSGGESHVVHSTITSNIATQNNGGGGMWISTGNPIYRYNIIAENKAGPSLVANNVVTSNAYLGAQYNLLDNVSGVSSVFPTSSSGGTNIVANAQLGAFGYSGGFTDVRLLLASSPAIDAIPVSAGDDVDLDQRTFIRPIDGNLDGTANSDIGAVEMNVAATQYQAEALSVAAQTGEALTIENNSGYSGGQGRVKQANLNGSVTFQTSTVQPGTYGVIVWFKKASNAGRFQVAVGTSAGSTTNLGAVQDGYRSSAQYTKVNLGTITVTSAGTRFFKFTATGKHASSSAHWMFIDAIQLYRST